ncbi:hypothetical protein GCM10028801_44740 [Nocardioides maradonensis]
MTDITFAGNLATDPELRFTPTGAAVVEFRVIENRRVNNGTRENPDWADAEPNAFRVKAWRSLAEHIADSAAKGDRLTVTGRLVTEKYNDRETGEARITQYVVADEVGFSLKYHTVVATKATKTEQPS